MIRTDRVVRCTAIAGAIATAVVVLAGCTGAPNREQQAEDLERTVEAMPGVAGVNSTYSNNITLGARVSLSVNMRQASIEEVEAVAGRIAEGFRREFDEYKREASFLVRGGSVEHATHNPDDHRELSPADVAADARTVREIHSAAPSEFSEINWERNDLGSELSVVYTSNDSVLGAVHAAVGNQQVSVLARPDRSRDGVAWRIDFPFSATDEAQVRNILTRSPLDVTAVDVSGGSITGMTVTTSNPAQAHARLVSLIEAATPSREHPLLLEWDQPDRPNSRSDLAFAGSVHVGGCGYESHRAGERNPQEYYTPAAIALRKQLREAYDTCPR